MTFELNTADQINAGFTWTLGIGVTSLDAFTAGSGSLPAPFSDMDWPGWLYHNMGAMKATVGAISITNRTEPYRLEIDSKAMRKLRLNEVLFAAI